MIDSINSLGYVSQSPVTASVSQTAKSAEAEAAEKTSKPVDQDTYESSGFAVDYNGKTYTSGAELVEQLKTEQAEQEARFIQTIKNSVLNQANEFSEKGLWQLISSGKLQVDAETSAAAKAAISEDGYWGVEQTAQRIVAFAKALTGGDTSQIETMKDAFIKGFKAAGLEWGDKDLPEISGQTYERVMELFDEWEQGGAVSTDTAEEE